MRNVQPSMIRKCTQRRDREGEDEHEGQLRPSLALSTLHGGLYGPSKKEGGDVLGSRPFPLQEMQLRRREKEEEEEKEGERPHGKQGWEAHKILVTLSAFGR